MHVKYVAVHLKLGLPSVNIVLRDTELKSVLCLLMNVTLAVYYDWEKTPVVAFHCRLP